MITGLHHINIVVTNLDEAIRFFEIFEFAVFERKALKGKWIDKVTGLEGVAAEYAGLKHEAVSTAVELLQYITPKGEKSPFISKANSVGIRHVAFQVADIETMSERLKKQGVPFLGSLQTNPYGKKMVYIEGPDGIILELAEL